MLPIGVSETILLSNSLQRKSESTMMGQSDEEIVSSSLIYISSRGIYLNHIISYKSRGASELLRVSEAERIDAYDWLQKIFTNCCHFDLEIFKFSKSNLTLRARARVHTSRYAIWLWSIKLSNSHNGTYQSILGQFHFRCEHAKRNLRISQRT